MGHGARDNLSMSRERTGLAFGQTARRCPTLPQISQLLPLEGHVRARWPALPQTLQVFELATIFLSRCGELGVMSRLRLVAAGAACGAGSASSVPVEQQIKAAMGSGRGNATV